MNYTTGYLSTKRLCLYLLVAWHSVTMAALCRYVPYKGALDPSQMQEFIDGIRSGAARGVPLLGDLAQPATITAWDGKDGKVEEVEEFSLDDIMGDEL